tara:strand:+ start:194 stop:670 length:477 start_codon:yes stop_codon:yes gene_type:complete
MDRVKTENKQIAQNAHCVERDSVPSVMSVESFIKEERNTMKKISLEQAKIMSSAFNLTLEEMIESGMVATPKVAGGKGMDILEGLRMQDKTLVDLPAPLEVSISDLLVGQKLQLLKMVVAELNQSDEFNRIAQEKFPNLVEGLQIEFNWKDKSKINKK